MVQGIVSIGLPPRLRSQVKTDCPTEAQSGQILGQTIRPPHSCQAMTPGCNQRALFIVFKCLSPKSRSGTDFPITRLPTVGLPHKSSLSRTAKDPRRHPRLRPREASKAPGLRVPPPRPRSETPLSPPALLPTPYSLAHTTPRLVSCGVAPTTPFLSAREPKCPGWKDNACHHRPPRPRFCRDWGRVPQPGRRCPVDP